MGVIFVVELNVLLVELVIIFVPIIQVLMSLFNVQLDYKVTLMHQQYVHHDPIVELYEVLLYKRFL